MTVDTSDLRQTVARRQTGGGKTIRQIVEEQKAQIARALPKVVSPERFTRLVLTELSRTPKLQECTAQSLLGALMYAAGLGVEPGPLGHAYLVPYGKDCTFILGYKGMLELARRSGEILSIEAREVREHDEFDFSVADDAYVRHRWVIDQDRGKVIGYYGIAKFRNGGKFILPMSLADIEARRRRSTAKDKGPWVTDYDAMARKTVIRAMAPWLPLTPEAATAFQQDEVQVRFDPDRSPDEALEIIETESGGEPTTSKEVPQERSAGAGGEAGPELVGSPPSDGYEQLSAEELTAACADAGLPTSGTKAEKIARLRALEAPFL